MERRTRINYTPEQKAIIRDRYKQGDSLHDIARMFDRFHSSVMPTIHQTCGYRPPVRKRHRLVLSPDEREEISRELVAKRSVRNIAAKLSRAPSTISREIRRHGGAKQYRASKADTATWENALRPKPCKLNESPALCKIIAEKMHQDWSPEQIAGWLKRCYPDNQELQQCLRSGRVVRRTRTSSLKGKGLRSIPHTIPVSERPPDMALKTPLSSPS